MQISPITPITHGVEGKSVILKGFGGIINKFIDKPWFDQFVNKTMDPVDGDKFLNRMVCYGNATKDGAIGATYTVISATNPELPPDKRVFVSIYDFIIGAVCVPLDLIFGLLVIAKQDKYVDRFTRLTDNLKEAEEYKTKGLQITKELERKLAKSRAVSTGIRFLLPIVVMTMFVKRVVAPIIAVPTAGIIKKKLEERSERNKRLK